MPTEPNATWFPLRVVHLQLHPASSLFPPDDAGARLFFELHLPPTGERQPGRHDPWKPEHTASTSFIVPNDTAHGSSEVPEFRCFLKPHSLFVRLLHPSGSVHRKHNRAECAREMISLRVPGPRNDRPSSMLMGIASYRTLPDRGTP
ncbi:hypothetical protein ZHAS_00014510 [Anopheles sinensis]|uniref:Uncharacterized protein n=1 Tax=Anopheles sinensis TaxID=74873 RepID=A0A084W8H4_ANOSI|nr:hypothetical protein ZHAS_00014510 [Anopheles sinensis]